jgi:acetyl esterase/lipase
MSKPTINYPSLSKRISWTIKLYTINGLIQLMGFISRIFPSSRSKRPTYVKYYPTKPYLVNHVWIPNSYKPGISPLLPLLIDIHGGGFCIGHPVIDDRDNAIFCHTHGICVVSINYRKAPGYPFPIPVEDTAELIEAVLDDPELPVDKTKVAMIGYSAGGNLCLTAPQLKPLHKRIKGVVPVYPAFDATRSLKTRMESATPSPFRQDVLVSILPMFEWAYFPKNQNLQDPKLSPIFAPRDVLPEKIYIIGCEYDLLCAEARELALKITELDSRRPNFTKEELGDGRVGWTSNTVTWEELKGLEHGFNQRYPSERNKECRELWKKSTEQMHTNIASWLFKEVYEKEK